MPRGKGAKADGIRFQIKLRDYLNRKLKGHISYEPWIYFEDSNGPGWAQLDFLVTPAGRAKHKIILEAKRTATWRAEVQLQGLYLPLLRFLEPETEFTLIQVAKHLVGQRTPIMSIEDVLDLPPGGTVHLWHWMP